MSKLTKKVFGFSLLVAIFALGLALVRTHPISAQNSSVVSNRPQVSHAERFGISAPLRELVRQQRTQPRNALHQAEPVRYPKLTHLMESAGRGSAVDIALQKMILRTVSVVPGLNLLGIGVGFPNFAGTNGVPGANLAVGATQVMQSAATVYAVFNKTTGAVELGPIEANTLWSGLPGSLCAEYNDGGLTVQYDKIAQRWVVAENVYSPFSTFATCIAVSQTSDAGGSYYEFEYPEPGFTTTGPSFGVWPDAYYQAQDNYGPGGDNPMGALPCAYDRSKLLVGDPSALQICFQQTTFDNGLLPADLDSSIPPTTGEAEVYLGSINNGNPSDSNTIYEYLFHVDFANPGDSTFTGTGGAMPIIVDSFSWTCPGSCIPQKGPGISIINPEGALNYRLAYSNFVSPTPAKTLSEADHQSWVVNHSVTSPTGQVGVRWYEFRAPEGSTKLAVFQQSTFAPDSNYRWVGSIAQDKMGDMLLGYSISSSSMYPSINYTGRVPTDPRNSMETEAQMFAGTGSSDDSSWQPFTSMALDSQDHCTFWYTNEYYMTSGENWSTRLGSFKFPNCN